MNVFFGYETVDSLGQRLSSKPANIAKPDVCICRRWARPPFCYVAFGKKMLCLFFADKDIDDLTRRCVRSPHFRYTSTYDLEGHLFQQGGLIDAVADACSITNHQAAALIGNPSTWIKKSAANWKEWIVLCVISHKHNINTGSTYLRPSNINQNYLRPTDRPALQAHMVALQTALGMTSAQFNRIFSSVASIVDRSLQSSNPLQYFKGKWLQLVLEKHLENGPKVPDSNFNGAGERVLCTLVAQVGSRTPCRMCSPFMAGIQQLGAALP
ncbi:hypothetical protein [Polaromonas sp. P5_E6]